MPFILYLFPFPGPKLSKWVTLSTASLNSYDSNACTRDSRYQAGNRAGYIDSCVSVPRTR